MTDCVHNENSTVHLAQRRHVVTMLFRDPKRAATDVVPQAFTQICLFR
jgi:hypothetical protein